MVWVCWGCAEVEDCPGFDRFGIEEFVVEEAVLAFVVLDFEFADLTVGFCEFENWRIEDSASYLCHFFGDRDVEVLREISTVP